MLKPVIHDAKQKLWCGPYAIAALTGQRTSIVYDILKDLRGAGYITGLWDEELIGAFNRLGYVTVNKIRGQGKTSAQFARKHKEIVVARTKDHYFVVVDGKVCDQSNQTPIDPEKAWFKDDVVLHAWTFAATRPAAPLPVKLTDKAEMSRAKVLAKRHGIEIEEDDDMWWVTCERFADDPLGDDHIAYNGVQVLEKVMTYVECLQFETA